MMQISTMKNMKEYEYIFNDIHSSFAASVVIYKESCYMLLNPLSLPNERMKELLEDRNEDAWTQTTLQKALQKRLGGNCKVYLSLVDKLNRRILLLAKKLKLSADLRVSSTRRSLSRFEMLTAFVPASLGFIRWIH